LVSQLLWLLEGGEGFLVLVGGLGILVAIASLLHAVARSEQSGSNQELKK
jgi:hypothetical protein